MRGLSSRFHKCKGPIKKIASTPPQKVNFSPIFIRKNMRINPKDKIKANESDIVNKTFGEQILKVIMQEWC